MPIRSFGVQATGNSNSMRAFWKPLRKAGAGARAMLVAGRGRAMERRSGKLHDRRAGEVIHAASGRRLGYGALVDAAARLTPPADPPLKDPKDFKLIGKPLKRLDTPDKVNGKAVYGIDVLPPGVKFATLAACPVFGGKVGHVDDSAAKAIPGVRQVVVLDDLVAVVGDHMWAAKKGLEALDITWDEGPNAHVNSALIWQRYQGRERAGRAPSPKRWATPTKALKRRRQRSRRIIEMPFLAHAPMEPMNCTVHVAAGRRAKSGSARRSVRAAQAIAAKVTGLPLEKVHRAQPAHRRRLRPPAGSRQGREGRAHRAAGRRAGQGRVDARGRHPARHLSPGLLRPPQPRR